MFVLVYLCLTFIFVYRFVSLLIFVLFLLAFPNSLAGWFWLAGYLLASLPVSEAGV